MSVQEQIEIAVATLLGQSIAGLVIVQGPTTTPRAEGSARFAAVRKTGSTGNRLEFGQTEWIEAFAVTLFWNAAAIPRATSQDEWETVVSAIRVDPSLGISVTQPSVEEAWLSSQTWGEAHDGNFRTMSATVTVRRIE